MKKFLIIFYISIVIAFFLAKAGIGIDFFNFGNEGSNNEGSYVEEDIGEVNQEIQRPFQGTLEEVFSRTKGEIIYSLEDFYKLVQDNDRNGVEELISKYSINLIGALVEEVDEYVEDLMSNSDIQPEEIRVKDLVLMENGVVLFKEVAKIDGEYYERYFSMIREENRWKINLFRLIDAVYFDPQSVAGKINIDIDTIARGINEINVIFRIINNTDERITVGKNYGFRTAIELHGNIYHCDFDDQFELMPGEASEYYFGVFFGLNTIPDIPDRFSIYNITLSNGKEINLSSDISKIGSGGGNSGGLVEQYNLKNCHLKKDFMLFCRMSNFQSSF